MLFAHSCIRMVHVTLQVQYIPYSREGVGFFFGCSELFKHD